MLVVKIGKKENINQALKRFKKKFRDTQVIKELRKRQEYKKPSAIKREKMLKAKYKQKFINNLDA